MSRGSRYVPYQLLSGYGCLAGSTQGLLPNDKLEFHSISPYMFPVMDNVVAFDVHPAVIGPLLPIKLAQQLARFHHIHVPSHPAREDFEHCFDNHDCVVRLCVPSVTLFSRPPKVPPKPFPSTPLPPSVPPVAPPTFPPLPLDAPPLCGIIRDWCQDISAGALREAACAVCAELVTVSDLSAFPSSDPLFSVLARPDAHVAVLERTSATEPIVPILTPLLDPAGLSVVGNVELARVCKVCLVSLRKARTPLRSLSNGLWLGAVPPVLQRLNFCEKLLVAVFRCNAFVGSVRMGQRYMRSNVITFPQPVPSFAKELPPPRRDFGMCLAILFVGSCRPSPDDLKRTPFLVRRSAVWDALLWLCANHSAYRNVVLRRANLLEYGDNGLPVSAVHHPVETTDDVAAAECLPVHHRQDSDDDTCSFAVHSLTADQLELLPRASRIAKAIEHIRAGGKVLAYGHDEQPESIFKNPKLLPGMFPWLFPYGLGGLENTFIRGRFGRDRHIQHCMLYHDRRFQLDHFFPFVLHSHNAIRSAWLGGYLLSKMKNFRRVADTMMQLKGSALRALVERGQRGDHVQPENDDERACFEIMHWVTHAGGHVPWSSGRKKEQRNEIRSLIYHIGTPMFFVTFSPADIKSPICLYYAGSNIDLFTACPTVPNAEERLKVIAQNPTAGARFFHLMVNLFIKHILQWQSSKSGVFGPTSGYYITVEAQGRMTLHAHGLIFIDCPMSLQQIRDRAKEDMAFQQSMISWLESVCISGLSTGPVAEIPSDDPRRSTAESTDPTLQLPTPPPPNCSLEDFRLFLQSVRLVVDRLVLKNHVHVCGTHCQRDGECRARFPREVREASSFDEDGALHLRHQESMMNSFNFILTYLMRCNTDVTCLLSGTQVRAVLGYVTDYVTKMQLKTYTLFDTMQSVFSDNADIVHDSGDKASAAQTLFVKTLNALHAKSETGGPMICASLLGNPDHYKSHVFKPFYWYSFLTYVSSETNFSLGQDGDDRSGGTVMVGVDDSSNVAAFSKVNDYIFRGDSLGDITLYDFYRRCTVERAKTRKDDVENDSDSEVHDATLHAPNIRSRPLIHVHRLQSDHPLSQTRRIHETIDYRLHVVDFRGNRLPRSSEGDELYCLTMLMLFKPGGWRNPCDIKAPELSWRQAFDSTVFDTHSVSVMANMNVLYECQDARDDYSAKRRRDKRKGMDCMAALGSQDLNELDVVSDVDAYVDTHLSHLAIDPLPNANDVSDRIRLQMEEMGDTLRELHAGAQECGGLAPVVGFATDCFQSLPSDHWSNILASEKSRVLRARNEDNVPSGPALPSTAPHYPADSSVCIISPGNCSGATHARYLEDVGADVFESDLATSQMKDICAHFTLNKEQVRAFVIIASAVTTPGSQQLLMYLGGMGGTGKSQVIKALTSFFTVREERRRLLLMAPTGAAACLIGGSTYHSMLRVSTQLEDIGPAKIESVRHNLSGVDVLFIDEVSMISTADLQKMSSNVCKARNVDAPFGGLHVVLAGDFCQLPPAGPNSTALYSRNTFTRTSNSAQTRAIGCFLWLQFTCVVILRRNMRQAGLSLEDAKFRTALANVRLCLCTDDDIELFESRVCGLNTDLPHLLHSNFENVSIITALNSHRDAINSHQSSRFARSRGVRLFHFYSRDSLTRTHGGGNLGSDVQKRLWRLPPCSLPKPVPGILSLSIGMPVMIKYNEATELCVTNGAEATVVGWVADSTESKRLVLRVLFVKLTNPALPVTLPGLPENVVPLVPRTYYLRATIGGKNISFRRSQVPVLVNFGMTDYASQGRTRPYNVVDPRHCRTTQSLYTCLSRGSSLSGLLLLNRLSVKKLKGGLNGHLRDELNELEILADITEMKYEGRLHEDVQGMSRRQLLRSFRAVYGKSYRAKHADDLRAGSSLKRVAAFPPPGVPPPSIRPRLTTQATPITPRLPQLIPPSPEGLRWDAVNHSCAYDSFLTIVLNTSRCFPSMWQSLHGNNMFMDRFFSKLNDAQSLMAVSNLTAGEQARNNVRDFLHEHLPQSFPRLGAMSTDIDLLAQIMTVHKSGIGYRLVRCTVCDVFQQQHVVLHQLVHLGVTGNDRFEGETSVGALLQELLFPSNTSMCPHCRLQSVVSETVYHSIPSVLGLELPLNGHTNIKIDHVLTFTFGNDVQVWVLAGVIYYGHSHFSCRFLDDDGIVWYHDGIQTGSSCTKDANDINSAGDMASTRGLRACLALYRLLQ